MELSQALPTLRRYTEDLGEGDRFGLLEETSVKRTVGGEEVQLYDPYAAALTHLMHPNTLKQRSEGETSETYIDLGPLVSFLQGKSAEVRAMWPLDDSAATLKPNLELNIVGWG